MSNLKLVSMVRCLAIRAAALSVLFVAGCVSARGVAADRVWLERHPETELRVLVWNVDRAFFRDNTGFQQVLGAVDADLLILDEMPPGVSDSAIAKGLPARRVSWQVLYGTGGGPHQRASIAARLPLQRVSEFDHLAYPSDRLEGWLKPVRADRQQRARETLLAGVAAVGGIIELKGRRVLVVAVDLQCCGDSVQSPEEDRRRFESLAIRQAIDGTAAGSKVDAVLLGGDFNTVNGNEPIRIMQHGMTQRTFLVPADVSHRGSDTKWTWDGRGTPYPSRQIDYVLHSDSLIVLQAQVFDTEDLALELSESLGLAPQLSRSLSPHRPVVLDLRWRSTRKPQ